MDGMRTRWSMAALGVALVAGWSPSPQAPEYIEEALTPFRSPPDSAEIAELLDRWRRDGGLAGPQDRILGARLWRRAGEARAGLSLLGELPDADDPWAPLARLERARIGLELSDDPEVAVPGAAVDWHRACESVGTAPESQAGLVREELWEDFGFLATPDEHAAWDTIPDSGACDWLEALLEERAFRMAVTPDRRLALHYDRLRTVRTFFYLRRPRFYVGMTHWHGRREGQWVDDRGLIYMRMGPPDAAEACGAVLPFEADPFEGDLLATCWVYDRPEGYKIYYFSTRDRVTGQWHGSGDYYLQESLGPRAFPGDAFFHRYVKNADIPRSLIRFLTFSRNLSINGDDFDAGLDGAEAQAYRRQAQVATRRFADEALIEIPDVPRVRGLEMLWEPLRFLNPADGSWQVWIVASVPAGQLWAWEGVDTWTYETRARLAARRSDGVELDSASNRAVVSAPLADDAGLPVRTFVVAQPGPLPVTLAVADGARPGVGAWVQDTIDVPRALPMPTVSDIAVAQEVGGDWTRDGETFLRVSPDHVTGPDGEIHIYFEVYGVRRTADYEVELRLTRDESPDQVFALDPSELPFRLSFTGRMPYDRIGRHSLRLDLSDTPPGAYDLAVRVRDVDTGTHSLPTVTPIVVAR
jgi:hypothetical protein